jgi:hypothetical protein
MRASGTTMVSARPGSVNAGSDGGRCARSLHELALAVA